MDTVTRTWYVYGRNGHRQRESFHPSEVYDFSRNGNIRIISVLNSDMTNTNEYTVVRITRNTELECYEELRGQLTDGIFENSEYGTVQEVFDVPVTML